MLLHPHAKSVVIHCHWCTGEISHSRALKWFATIFFGSIAFKYFPSSHELFSESVSNWSPVRHDSVIPGSSSCVWVEFKDRIWKPYTNFIGALRARSWSLLKLWILPEVLSEWQRFGSGQQQAFPGLSLELDHGRDSWCRFMFRAGLRRP